MAEPRNQRKEIVGTVVNALMQKTVTVAVATQVPHPRYNKRVWRRTRLKVHDEQNQAKEGDVVRVMATRPLSKTKRWRLVEVIKTAPRVGGAAKAEGEPQ